MRQICRTIALAFMALTAGVLAAAPEVSQEDLARLIVMQDRQLGPILTQQIHWIGPGQLMATGWEHWPDDAAIMVYGVGLPSPWLPQPHAPPLAALTADRHSVIYWRGGEDGAQLCRVRLSDGQMLLLDPDLRCQVPGPIVATAGEVVAAACIQRDATVAIRRFTPGQASEVVATLPGVGCDLIPGDEPNRLIVTCEGERPRSYRIDLVDGLCAEIEPPPPRTPDTLPAGIELDAAGRRLVRLVGEERVILAEDVHAACALPGAPAVICMRPDGLWVVESAGAITRRLWGADPPAGLQPGRLSCSPDGVEVAHAWQGTETGELRLGQLGTEQVVVRLRFPEGSVVEPGDEIWVAERFQVDDNGLVTEPVWGTLKALLRADEVLTADTGKVVAAHSIGLEGGVVERLTGSNDPPPGSEESGARLTIGVSGQEPARWVEQFSAEPLATLAGWTDGDTAAARLLTVDVTRRRLGVDG